MSPKKNPFSILQEIEECLRTHLNNRMPHLDKICSESIIQEMTGHIRSKWGGFEVYLQRSDLDKIDHEKQLRFFF